ncbi:polysaccharide pyruvyl transferase CsaB [Sinanaerobacter chloroacetimidivorans]|uniref:Polysaccharide pyruvyl transferase CsaB n=1 Tax=Sinanaerobacter chloroacetimidivorans TaxID=2818044 RepID=A0A8J7W4I4_9FIRM|nr:polysaccharide pyruvyl transferase CsaB [Sinanaerobacter chloroacetimidivorans]MBR0598921.1 polysaccharide pyruvyl transferase CsaB [Sinanaerobacter chloroacetimidivorans]
MYKILISGYYGFNNIGDESILRAVIDNLRGKLDQIEITVLSQNPEFTSQKYGVNSVNRKSVKDILRAMKSCDLLISGGGSLLQDVTSKKSILYYLMMMWLAQLFGKKFFIYSQGIGPILSKLNRHLTAATLKKASGIVVRDEASKELLIEIGIPSDRIIVTADPVLRVKKADLTIGQEILKKEGFVKDETRMMVGWAIREKKIKSNFVDEICISIQRLVSEYQAQIVLIPFHFSEDMAVIEEIESRLGNDVCCIKHKYLTEEMLSIIGNMDILVGVRLHALIHAAIMDVPMIAISYDPKINSFMHSMDMKAMCSMYDFQNEFFIEEFEKTILSADRIREKVKSRIELLIKKLDTNENLIKELMKK